MRRRCPWRPIAPHHIQYADPAKGIPERKTLLYNTEHRALTTNLRLLRNPKIKVSNSYVGLMFHTLYQIKTTRDLLSEEDMAIELALNHQKRLERQKKRRRKK
jgi:hypothetical protein